MGISDLILCAGPDKDLPISLRKKQRPRERPDFPKAGPQLVGGRADLTPRPVLLCCLCPRAGVKLRGSCGSRQLQMSVAYATPSLACHAHHMVPEQLNDLIDLLASVSLSVSC